MLYWEAVLNEVLNKHNPQYDFWFTNIHFYQAEKVKESIRKAAKHPTQTVSVKPGAAFSHHLATLESNKQYMLGEQYPTLYLTRREAECMVFLLRGCTFAEVGQHLHLSPRTVEFYVARMKYKLKCGHKSELIEKIRQSDFSNSVDF